MSHGGKGSSPRPFSVSQKEYETRWDAIFRRDGLEEDTTTDSTKSKSSDSQKDKQEESAN